MESADRIKCTAASRIQPRRGLARRPVGTGGWGTAAGPPSLELTAPRFVPLDDTKNTSRRLASPRETPRRPPIRELLPVASLQGSVSRDYNTTPSVYRIEPASLFGRLTVPLYQGGEYSRIRESKETLGRRRWNRMSRAMRCARR